MAKRKTTWKNRIVFAKNFRGFEYLEIDLNENLFLVGDNSSGKSSILHLVDFVCSTDLMDAPELNDELFVGRFDFFSPFFNEADVTIGITVQSDTESVARIITISKSNEEYPTVKKCTLACDSIAMTLLHENEETWTRKFDQRNNWSPLSLLKSHETKTDFVKLNTEKKGRVNSPFLFLDAIISSLNEDTVPSSIGTMLVRDLTPYTRHVSPVRASPEYFYVLDRRFKPLGTHFAALMHDVQDHIAEEAKRFQKIINKFGKESGLFDRLLFERPNSDSYESPIFVRVEIRGEKFYLHQVGIGVSQVAPILAETQSALVGVIPVDLLLIQQPELHLHPMAQAALGEYFFEASKGGFTFIIETHSDYLIDRFRARVNESNKRRKKKQPSRMSIGYCYSSKKGNKIRRIKIDEKGRLVDPPPSYHRFFMKELSRTIF